MGRAPIVERDKFCVTVVGRNRAEKGAECICIGYNIIPAAVVCLFDRAKSPQRAAHPSLVTASAISSERQQSSP